MKLLLLGYFDQKSSFHVISVGLVLLVLVAIFDFLSGGELSFSIFYLLPIILVTWFLERWTGLAFCILAASTWLLVETNSHHNYSSPFIPVWNTLVRFSFFLITTTLLTKLKNLLIVEKNMSKIDGLTGLLNARAFKDLSSIFLDLATRKNHSVVLGYIDIDNFKQVNDQSGHSEGDCVLKAVANALTNSVRTTDVVGRIGGDEFAIFLPETDHAMAQIMFGRIHEELTKTALNGSWPIGFSIGVAVFSYVPSTIDEALKKADALMYRVKKTGKNNLVYENHIVGG